MVVSTGAVRMSVPIVPAQTIKQVTPHSNRDLFKISPELEIMDLVPCRLHRSLWRQRQSSPPLRLSNASSCLPLHYPRSSPTSPTSPPAPSWLRLQEEGTWATQLCQHNTSHRWVVLGSFFHSPLVDIHVFLFISCHVFCASAAPAASVCDPLQQPQFPSIHWCPDSGQITTEWVRRDMKSALMTLYHLSAIWNGEENLCWY